MDVYSFLGEVSASEMSTESCSMVFFFRTWMTFLLIASGEQSEAGVSQACVLPIQTSYNVCFHRNWPIQNPARCTGKAAFISHLEVLLNLVRIRLEYLNSFTVNGNRQ